MNLEPRIRSPSSARLITTPLPPQTPEWSPEKEFASLMGDIGTLGRQLVEWGWSRDQVLAYVTQLLNEPTGPTSGDPDAGKEED